MWHEQFDVDPADDHGHGCAGSKRWLRNVFLPTEMRRADGNQGSGDDKWRRGSQCSTPHSLQPVHHEETDHDAGGDEEDLTSPLPHQTALPMKPKAEHILNMPAVLESLHSLVQVTYHIKDTQIEAMRWDGFYGT